MINLNVILYSTGCPKCNVLKKKLDNLGIEYTVNSDRELMQMKGFNLLPVLEVDDIPMEFKRAIDWVNNKE